MKFRACQQWLGASLKQHMLPLCTGTKPSETRSAEPSGTVLLTEVQNILQ